MTAKRFTVPIKYRFSHSKIQLNGEPLTNDELVRILNTNDGAFVENFFLKQENEQLKKREEQLLSEIGDFQQLLIKNDNLCYKRVIDLIDARIKDGEEAIEWGKNMNIDYGAMGFHIEMLKKLKKELQE